MSRSKELALFNLELGPFLCELVSIGSGGDWKRARSEPWDDANLTNSYGWKRKCQKRNLLYWKGKNLISWFNFILKSTENI